MKNLMWFVLLFGIVGCGKSSHDGTLASTQGNAQNSTSPGFLAFKSSFYAFAQTQNCAKCHASLVTPRFAAADINEAYAQAKGTQIGNNTPLIDFSNPNASIIAVYAGNSHCGDTPCSNPANTAVVQALLATWAAGEMTSTSNNGGGTNGGGGTATTVTPKYLTASMPLPAAIPALTVTNPALIRIPLSSLNPPVAKLANAILEVEVQMSNATTYRFRRPKVFGNSASVSVVGMHVYLNTAAGSGVGTEDINDSALWINIGKPTPLVAAVVAKPATLPVTPVNAVPFTANSMFYTTDMGTVITVGFEDLQ